MRLGTYDVLLTITSLVQKFLDANCEVHTIRFDFNAAIDLVIHKALIFKLM